MTEEEIMSILNEAAVKLSKLINREVYITVAPPEPNKEAFFKITKTVSDIFGVNPKEVINGRRGKLDVVEARQLSMWFIYKGYGNKSNIGRYFSKDHSSVVHTIKVIKDRIHTREERTIHYIGQIESAINHLHES